MKINVFILFFILAVLVSCNSTENELTDTIPKSGITSGFDSALYLFYGSYYDLETLQLDSIVKNPMTHFKLCSKFKGLPLKDDENSPEDDSVKIVAYPKGAKFWLMDTLLGIVDPHGRVKNVRIYYHKTGQSDHYASLMKFDDGALLLADDRENYTFKKYNKSGKEVYSEQVPNSLFTEERGWERQLYYKSRTSKELIFTPSFFETKKNITMVFNVETGKVTNYDYMASGVILDEEREILTGFIVRNDTMLTIKMIDRNKEYRLKYSNEFGDAFKTALSGDLLLIASYDPASTGTGLKCFDLNSGKIKWEAEVGQISADHSEYYNSLYLSLYKNKVILEDIQTSGNYLQVFDLSTGKRLAVFGSIVFTEAFLKR